MKKITSSPNLLPILLLGGITIFFIISFLRGSFLVQKSEKELNPKRQIEEAQAKKYELKEIDAKTGEVRWQLTAKNGETRNHLQGAFIKDVKAEVYKNMEVIFDLSSPFAKANSQTKELYLYGEVTAKDKNGNFLLQSKQVALGMGTAIEAQKGFDIILKNTGRVIGNNALINEDQTKITVKGLKEASFKDVLLSGDKVYIERNTNGELTNAIISNGGRIILKNSDNDILLAKIINWSKDGEIEAFGNVTYTSKDKVFKADNLLIKPNKNIYAKNNVLIAHKETKCFGSSLTFENNEFVTITGKPKAFQNDKQISADKIIYNIHTDKVEAIGNVRTTIIERENQLSTTNPQ